MVHRVQQAGGVIITGNLYFKSDRSCGREFRSRLKLVLVSLGHVLKFRHRSGRPAGMEVPPPPSRAGRTLGRNSWGRVGTLGGGGENRQG